MIDYYAPNIDLTLLGCGFLANYHLGAIYLLSQVWPHRPYNRICGASCGGMVAALLVSGITLERVIARSMDIMSQLSRFIKKPTRGLLCMHEMLEQLLHSVLPQNAHQICTNRLGISVTRATWPIENLFVSQFESRQDLIDAVVAGCFIPLWSGSLEFPKYKGQKCVDGGYSDNTPKFPNLTNDHQESNCTRATSAIDGRYSPSLRQVELCAFASETDVCPPDRTLIPFDAKVYRHYFVNGHRDMKNYILSNDMVRCQQCTWIKQPPAVRWSCLACLKLIEKIDSLKVPTNLIK